MSKFKKKALAARKFLNSRKGRRSFNKHLNKAVKITDRLKAARQVPTNTWLKVVDL